MMHKVLKECFGVGQNDAKFEDGIFTTAMITNMPGASSRSHVNRQIRKGVEDGIFEFAGKVESENICGVKQKVPAYRIIKEKE